MAENDERVTVIKTRNNRFGREQVIVKDSRGRFTKGTQGMPGGRQPKERTLKNVMEDEFSKIVTVYYPGEETATIESKLKIMARHITDMIVYGQIQLPSQEEGEKGRVIKLSGDDYMKHVLRVIKYIEPPVDESQGLVSGVEAIIWDLPIGQELKARKMKIEAQELLISGQGSEEDESV